MKNLTKKLAKVFLPVMFLICLMGISASAAGTKTVNFKNEGGGYFSYTGVMPDYQTTVYHKITVKKAGALVITGFGATEWGSTSGIKVQLCNSKKKALEAASSVNAERESYVTYAVNKGVYYVKVAKEKYYYVGMGYVPVSEKSGSKKTKAVSIKTNKTVMGVLGSGESSSKADWYKFKVTKSRVLKVETEALGTGYVEFHLYGPSYKKGIRLSNLKNKGCISTSIQKKGSVTKQLKIKKGTYYIRVKRNSNSKKSSAVYSIKWYLK